MGYRVLSAAIVVVHFAYLGYAVSGGFLAWRWPRALWPHLVAATWGVAVIALRLECPLTFAQNWARRRAGEPPLTGGFIDHYVSNVLYPERYTALVQALVATLVAASWVMAVRRPLRPARSRSRSRTR